jgi:sterol desaturase/sphingolipid hydroxylase (fatty acid hydroxylase superfamily)
MVWPVQHLWTSLGFKSYLIPLWSLLSPLRWWGYAIEVLIVLLVWDFARYWRHRAEHKWFWPIHAVHHSPDQLHAANSLGHPLQGFIELALVTIPLSLIQFSGPTDFPIVSAISSALTLYIHSPTHATLGPAWRVIVDPRFHRIHHSLEPRHFDKNFAVCFSIWDSLFGTAYWPEKGEWPAVGVKEYPAPRNFWQFLILPLGAPGKRNQRVRRMFPAIAAFTADWRSGSD